MGTRHGSMRTHCFLPLVLYAASACAIAGHLPWAIEYYHGGRDHYFIATTEAEIKALDSDALPGWRRTSVDFQISWSQYFLPHPWWEGEYLFVPMQPVCRFYLPPAHGDSHFFSASIEECFDVRRRYPAFLLEAEAVFYVGLPGRHDGACPTESLPSPVYRLWNARADTNHRYVTTLAQRDAMIAKGWVSEGYGPLGVAFCVGPS